MGGFARELRSEPNWCGLWYGLQGGVKVYLSAKVIMGAPGATRFWRPAYQACLIVERDFALLRSKACGPTAAGAINTSQGMMMPAAPRRV